MLIKHAEGMYTLESKKTRNIVEENVNGKQTEEVYKQYCDDYKKVIKEFNGKKWAKKAILHDFGMGSNVSDELVNNHVKWALENGMQCVAMVVGSAVVKMKMNRLLKQSDSGVETVAFADEAEADEWLKEKGF